jgi:uncharacterized protein
VETIPAAQLRRFVVAHQGYTTRRRRGTAREVFEAVRRLSCVQLDSISTVERSHRIVLSSRVGNYPRATVSRLLREGKLFEYWAHEACLLPIEDWPLFRHRMTERHIHHWFGPVIDGDPELCAKVLGEIRERGALGSRHFEGAGSGGMWNWKPAKRMLEALWTAGRLAVAGRDGFQRLYDLPERVIPAELLDKPAPNEAEWLRGLALRAVRARGALTEFGIKEHYRLRGGVARLRPHIDALVAEGLLRRLAVDDSGPQVLVPAEAALDAEPSGAVLLSPFDNLLWDRDFARRVLGFDHLIEVYKPQPERVYGYYVLPLLRGDRIVGRADLKSDRKAGTLRVLAFHRETGVRRSGALDEALGRALERLAQPLGLDTIER